MEHGTAIPHFRELVVFLATAGIVVPVFQRLRLSPVLGFLCVGMLIGPYGVTLFAEDLPWLAAITISDLAGVRVLAEFGVVFLLFMIGLEMSIGRLWQMRRLVFGLGLAQVLLAAAAIAGIAALLGSSAPAAIVIGACLSLSSTAIVMQLLIERRRAATPVGRTSFAVLLMQDFAVVPILFMIGALARFELGSDNLLWQLGRTLLIAAATIAAIVLLGRRLLGPLFRSVGAARSPELFMALTLLVVIGMAAATGAAGLSMALGAFLAGLLLAESEYRHAVEVSIEPFKGLLLGLFFMSVGMGIDIRIGALEAAGILLAVAGLFAVKALILGALVLAFRQSRATALETALLLGQGGEFAFVAVGQAQALGLLDAGPSQFLLLVVSLSMLATPFIASRAQDLARRMEGRRAATDHGVETAEPHEGHVLISGFGRVGKIVARLLDAEAIPWLALDFNSVNVAEQRHLNRPVHFGDGSRIELLERLDAGKALALVVTLDDPVATGHLVAEAHRRWPTLPIYARARDRFHAVDLRKLGAAGVVAEAIEASLQLGGLALNAAGLPEDAVFERLERQRVELGAARRRPPEQA